MVCRSMTFDKLKTIIEIFNVEHWYFKRVGCFDIGEYQCFLYVDSLDFKEIQVILESVLTEKVTVMTASKSTINSIRLHDEQEYGVNCVWENLFIGDKTFFKKITPKSGKMFVCPVNYTVLDYIMDKVK